MSTDFHEYPYVTTEYSDADREARMRSSRHRHPYVVGERLVKHGELEYLVAPLAEFDQYHEVGWLIYNTYGEPRDPSMDYRAYSTIDLEDAMLEAALRLHRVGVATVVAVRGDGEWTEYLVAPLADFPRLEAVDWRVRDLFLPD